MSIHYKYFYETSITFCKTKEANGALSNMAGGYPIRMGDKTVRTSEHLYQTLKYTDHPDIQNGIIAIPSPMAAKWYANRFKTTHIRKDWDYIKVPVMEWCLNLKLLNNLDTFGKLLTSLDDTKDIVEYSKKDDFWGAKPIDEKTLVGGNNLGRLLWVLMKKYKSNLEPHTNPIIKIPDFFFDGKNATEMAMFGLEKYILTGV